MIWDAMGVDWMLAEQTWSEFTLPSERRLLLLFLRVPLTWLAVGAVPLTCFRHIGPSRCSHIVARVAARRRRG